MKDTKERIMQESLKLFSKYGYDAVSVNMIAESVGITKSALYKHYKSKRDVFESILLRMEHMDSEGASEHGMPEVTYAECADEYMHITCDKLKEYTISEYIYWTEDEFSSLFRKMLTIEKHRDEDMAKLYDNYLLCGPLEYVEKVFFGITKDEGRSKQLALKYYAPMYFLYDVYDNAENKKQAADTLRIYLDEFFKSEGL